MAAEISYTSLKISRQVRECVSKFCLNVYLMPRVLKPMVWLILKESCTTEAVFPTWDKERWRKRVSSSSKLLFSMPHRARMF